MVSRIGHVGLVVTDLDRSVVHAERIMGLRVSERDSEVAYLTCNERHHELILRQGEAVGCEQLGLEVYDEGRYEALAESLAEAGWDPREDAEVEPGIMRSFRFTGPGGFVFKVFHGMSLDQPRYYETTAPRPEKFEHITVKSAHKEELERLLIDLLGFRLSDRAEDAISWLRASQEHHGMSVIAADDDMLQHYAWTVPGFAFMARIGDHLMEHGKTFLWGPGHHGIGDNYFSYFRDEDGAIVEYSSSMLRIEDEGRYVASTWPDDPLSVNRWGNPPPPVEFIEGGIPLVAREGVR